MAMDPNAPQDEDFEAYDAEGFDEDGAYDEDFDEDDDAPEPGWQRRAMVVTAGVLLLGLGTFWALTNNVMGNIPVVGTLLTTPSPIPGAGPFAAPGGYGKVKAKAPSKKAVAVATATASAAPQDLAALPPDQLPPANSLIKAAPAAKAPASSANDDDRDPDEAPAPAPHAHARHGTKPSANAVPMARAHPHPHAARAAHKAAAKLATKPHTKANRQAARQASPAAAGHGAFTVQVGVFANATHAQNLVQALQDRGFQAYRSRAELGSTVASRVLVGTYASREEAQRASQELRDQAFPAIIVQR